MKSRSAYEQVIGFLNQAAGGVVVKELCRLHGCSDATLYRWKGRVGRTVAADARRFPEIAEENTKR